MAVAMQPASFQQWHQWNNILPNPAASKNRSAGKCWCSLSACLLCGILLQERWAEARARKEALHSCRHKAASFDRCCREFAFRSKELAARWSARTGHFRAENSGEHAEQLGLLVVKTKRPLFGMLRIESQRGRRRRQRGRVSNCRTNARVFVRILSAWHRGGASPVLKAVQHGGDSSRCRSQTVAARSNTTARFAKKASSRKRHRRLVTPWPAPWKRAMEAFEQHLKSKKHLQAYCAARVEQSWVPSSGIPGWRAELSGFVRSGGCCEAAEGAGSGDEGAKLMLERGGVGVGGGGGVSQRVLCFRPGGGKSLEEAAPERGRVWGRRIWARSWRRRSFVCNNWHRSTRQESSRRRFQQKQNHQSPASPSNTRRPIPRPERMGWGTRYIGSGLLRRGVYTSDRLSVHESLWKFPPLLEREVGPSNLIGTGVLWEEFHSVNFQSKI